MCTARRHSAPACWKWRPAAAQSDSLPPTGCESAFRPSPRHTHPHTTRPLEQCRQRSGRADSEWSAPGECLCSGHVQCSQPIRRALGRWQRGHHAQRGGEGRCRLAVPAELDQAQAEIVALQSPHARRWWVCARAVRVRRRSRSRSRRQPAPGAWSTAAGAAGISTWERTAISAWGMPGDASAARYPETASVCRLRRRREFCHSAAPPSAISRRFNMDGEGGVSKMTASPTASAARHRPACRQTWPAPPTPELMGAAAPCPRRRPCRPHRAALPQARAPPRRAGPSPCSSPAPPQAPPSWTPTPRD